MLMLDVRNAISGILDRHSLADVVEVTLRKMRRDGVPLPFAGPEREAGRSHERRRRGRPAPAARRLQPVEGLINNLLGDYTI